MADDGDGNDDCDWLVVGVTSPCNIKGHIRMDTDL